MEFSYCQYEMESLVAEDTDFCEDFLSIDAPDDLEREISESIESFEIVDKTNVPLSAYQKDNAISFTSKQEVQNICNKIKLAYCPCNTEEVAALGYKTMNDYSRDGYKVFFIGKETIPQTIVYFKNAKVDIIYKGASSIYECGPGFRAFFSGVNFAEGFVHQGFYDKFNKSEDLIMSCLQNIADKTNLAIKDLDITIAGHSLGGALSQILGLKLKSSINPEKIKIITFGAPRVFDNEMAQYYNDILGKNTLRVVQHRLDIIPAVPTGLMNYKHAGLQLRLNCDLTKTVPHKIDSYFLSLQELTDANFISENSPSVFHMPLEVFKSWF
jgi:hypothetical protein